MQLTLYIRIDIISLHAGDMPERNADRGGCQDYKVDEDYFVLTEDIMQK